MATRSDKHKHEEEKVVSLAANQTDPFSQTVAKLILGDIDGLTPPSQSNRVHDKLLKALIDNNSEACGIILSELNERDLNQENDEWAYNDFTLLLALASSMMYKLDKAGLERLSSYRLKLDENDSTASELKLIISDKSILNSMSVCAHAIAGASQPISNLEESYLSICRENNRNNLSPFRAFITHYAIVHLNAKMGTETLRKSAQLESFIDAGATRMIREAKFVHAGIIVAAIGWLVFLSIKYFQGGKEWRELLGWISFVGATAPIALICSMAWKRKAFLNWYLNFKFSLFGGTKYIDLNGQ